MIFTSGSQNVVPTDGGRYDVFIDDKVKRSVYFDAKDLEVRRSTWFYQISSNSRYNPYDEEIAKTLEVGLKFNTLETSDKKKSLKIAYKYNKRGGKNRTTSEVSSI